jgi:Uma2 family endonuclease
MATTVERPPAAIEVVPEQRVVLRGVSWGTYEALLADHADQRLPHFTYDRGLLEIVMPSSEHDEDAYTLESIVEIVGEEWDIEVRGVRSSTFRRLDIARGFEGDGAFYIHSAERVAGKRAFDLTVDPPPDLVIEIDVTHSSLDKLAVFAAMGVPEVWRLSAERVIIHRLGSIGYDTAIESGALRPLTADDLTRFLLERRSSSRRAWMRAVREWARQQGRGDLPGS